MHFADSIRVFEQSVTHYLTTDSHALMGNLKVQICKEHM